MTNSDERLQSLPELTVQIMVTAASGPLGSHTPLVQPTVCALCIPRYVCMGPPKRAQAFITCTTFTYVRGVTSSGRFFCSQRRALRSPLYV
jgi:hypothetical protein